jgi:hypothetical protein
VTVTSDTLVDVACDNGERFHCTLGTFCKDNAEAIDHRERVLITQTLAAGETYRGGGGAGVAWSISVAKAPEKPICDMHRVVSSNIASIGHDGEDLFVAFKSGGTYRYQGVPVPTFDALRAAKSVGSHLHAHIKGKFASVKVEVQS